MELICQKRESNEYTRTPHRHSLTMADQQSIARHSSAAVRFNSPPLSKTVRSTMSPRTLERKSTLLDNTAASFTPLLTPKRDGSMQLLSPAGNIRKALIDLGTSTGNQLEKTWNEVGYSGEDRASQLKDLCLKFEEICDVKIAEERGVAETFRQTIREAKDEIQHLASALKVDFDPKILEEKSTQTLTDQLDTLDAVLDGLRSKASAAREDLKECRDFLIEAYDALSIELEPKWRDIESDLTTVRREEFHLKRSEMKQELSTRTAAVIQLVRDCQQLMNDLRTDGESGSELDRRITGSLIRSKDDSFIMASRHRSDTCVGIGSTALEELTQRVAELHAEKRRRKLKLQEMGAQIAMLWEKLHISEEEQVAFTESVQGLGLDTIEKGESELKRLNAMKAQMIGKLIEEARESIKYLWEQTNADLSYRGSFESMKVRSEDLFDDNLLEKHEIYIKVLQDRLEEMKPILRLIEKREVIIKERMEYELLQKDSDRLKQRGAALTRQLMEEEKMAKRIKRDLPRLTDILAEKLTEWKDKHGEQFKYAERYYLDLMEEQELEWNDYKEQKHQRMLVKKQEEKILGDSRFAGKKRATPRQPIGDTLDKENSGQPARPKSRDLVKNASQRSIGQKPYSTNC
jgi:protein regulator of cytokinesis 1